MCLKICGSKNHPIVINKRELHVHVHVFHATCTSLITMFPTMILQRLNSHLPRPAPLFVPNSFLMYVVCIQNNNNGQNDQWYIIVTT